MRNLVLVSALLGCLLMGGQVFAKTTCSGQIAKLGLGPKTGTVQVSNGHGVWYMCDLHEKRNGVDPKICQGWYSMLLTAKASNREVQMSFETDKSCDQIGDWADPDPMPYWVELK